MEGGSPAGIHGLFSGRYCGLAGRMVTLRVSTAGAKGVTTGTLIQIPTLNEDIEDTAVWVSENGNEKCFRISNVWKDISCNDEKVKWYPLVWFAQNIPRHAFVTWLAIQERLMAQDRIKIWRPNNDLKCGLCSKCSDSHDHLFFTCEFSKEVCHELQNLLNSIVIRIVVNAALYFIWQERNNKIFKKEKRDKETIVKLIKENTVMKLIGLKVKEYITVNEVENKWKIKLQKV
ncbi:RNA-directed DNA polymerase, eukaryota, reverse transcriptase zinc-binding domain protein [Tanacetum coccineum]